jgi:hypothetical protein
MPPPHKILSLLQGADRRTIGRADEVAKIVSSNPKLFADVIAGMWSHDELLRMRAADAVEKITRPSPELLQPFKKELLGLAAESTQQELCWHLAVIVPRLSLTPKERQRAASLLYTYLKHRSSIVKTFALQGLADLAQQDASIRETVVQTLQEAARNGTAAMKARSRKLLLNLAAE